MKYFFVLITITILTLTSCTKDQKAPIPEENSTTLKSDSKDLFKVDSVKVQDSTEVLKHLTLSFDSKVLVFPNITSKALLDSIYSPVNISVQDYSKNNVLDALNKEKEKFYKENTENEEDWKPDFAQIWEQNSDMNLFSKLNNFMTIKYSMDGFTGGAHGYYNEIYKVFDTEKNSTLKLKDVVKNPTDKIWPKILMNNFLNGDLENGQAEMLLVKEIPLNNNFYFDQENLYFLYNQYEITAYAAGTVLIKIPFTEIKPLLTPEFKASLKL